MFICFLTNLIIFIECDLTLHLNSKPILISQSLLTIVASVNVPYQGSVQCGQMFVQVG